MGNKPPPTPGFPGVVQVWPCIDCYLRDRGVRIGEPEPAETVRGGDGGNHGTGNARDYGDARCDTWAVYNAMLPLANFPGCPVIELIWQDIFWKNGTRIGGIPGHYNHVHVAVQQGLCLACSDDGTGSQSMLGNVKQAAMNSCPATGVLVLGPPFAAAAGALAWWRWH
jgi:hypothetical protein